MSFQLSILTRRPRQLQAIKEFEMAEGDDIYNKKGKLQLHQLIARLTHARCHRGAFSLFGGACFGLISAGLSSLKSRSSRIAPLVSRNYCIFP